MTDCSINWDAVEIVLMTLCVIIGFIFGWLCCAWQHAPGDEDDIL